MESKPSESVPVSPPKGPTGQLITEIESEPPHPPAPKPVVARPSTRPKADLSKAKQKSSRPKASTTPKKRTPRKDPPGKTAVAKTLTSSKDDVRKTVVKDVVVKDVKDVKAKSDDSSPDLSGGVTKDRDSIHASARHPIGDIPPKPLRKKDATSPLTTAKMEPQEEQVAVLLKSGTLDDCITMLTSPLSAPNRQALIHKIIKMTYPRRKESKMRGIFLSHAHSYVDSVKGPEAASAISEYIHKSLAIVLQEDGKFKEAIALCQKAMELGLDDGTKTGYTGRIERLEKARQKKRG